MIANNSKQNHFSSKIILPVYINPVTSIQTQPGSVIGTIEQQQQKCHLCQKDFPSMIAFQNHLKEHHLDGKVYRNIIAVSAVNSPVTMIPAHTATVQQPAHQQYQLSSAVKIEKDFQTAAAANKSQTIIHTSDVIKQAYPSAADYATVTNINMTPVIQHIQIQSRDKDKASNIMMRQNPVEYHIQQQEHAAMVVAQMNQKTGISTPSFLNSTIKYELTQPLQLVAAEVFPHLLAEAKAEEQNHSPTSPSSSSMHGASSSSGPILSNGETMEKQHKCLICDKFFTTIANLNTHLRSHAGDKPYKCSICSKGFIQSNNLSTHMKTHTGEKPHECSICGKRFSQSNNLKTHYRTHTGEKPYRCSLCDKSFNQKNNLTTHLRTHSDYHPSSCSTCKQNFSSFNELFNHMRQHVEEKPLICSVCNKILNCQSDLAEHMKSHSNKPYKCDICQKQFTQSNNLKTHIKTHIYQDPFKCSMCTRSFQDQEEYQMHIRVHTVDKPYECTYCKKKFIQSNNLKTHLRTHTGEKPYRCAVCGKSFNQKNNLNTHNRVHTGEKPFECHLCDRRFNQSNNLNKHLKTHGQEKDITRAMESEMEKMMSTVIMTQHD